jgi:hypothetical protein
MKYGPDITAEICKHLALGMGRVDSCLLSDISYETFTRWMEHHNEFCEAIKKAEAKCKERNVALIQRAAVTTWQAAAWMLERKYPEEFAQRLQHTGADGAPLNLHSAAVLVIQQLRESTHAIAGKPALKQIASA